VRVSTNHSDEGEKEQGEDQNDLSAGQPEFGFTISSALSWSIWIPAPLVVLRASSDLFGRLALPLSVLNTMGGVSTNHSDEGEKEQGEDQNDLSAGQPEFGFTIRPAPLVVLRASSDLFGRLALPLSVLNTSPWSQLKQSVPAFPMTYGDAEAEPSEPPVTTDSSWGSLAAQTIPTANLWSACFAVVGPEYISMVAAEAKRPRVYIKNAFKRED
jgi:hypothetical protein